MRTTKLPAMPAGLDKPITVNVNGRPKEVAKEELPFLEVVRLAYPGAVVTDTIIFTVTYKRGHGSKPEGTLVDGENLKLKDGMIINVVRSDKS